MAGGYRSGMTEPGATPASLTQQEARDRAALIEVERYDIRVDLRELAEGDRWLATSSVTFTCREPGRLDVRRLRRRGAVGHPERRRARPVDRSRRPDPAARPGRGERAGRLLGADRHRLGRRDPAQRRPPGQAGLRLVDLRAGRRPAGLGLLRPARPQGGARLPGQRARRSGRCSATARPRWCSTATTAGGSGSSRTPRGSRRTSSWSTPARSTSSASSAATTASGLYCRQSLRPYLERDAEELFRLTEQGLAFFGERFAQPFPQERYDQVFVPDFGGAMENWGCVTWTDAVLHRSPPTYAQRAAAARWCCCTRWRTCGSATW